MISVAVSMVRAQVDRRLSQIALQAAVLACGPFERLCVVLWRKNECNISGLDHLIWTHACCLLVNGFSCILKYVYKNVKERLFNKSELITNTTPLCAGTHPSSMKFEYHLSPKCAYPCWAAVSYCLTSCGRPLEPCYVSSGS